MQQLRTRPFNELSTLAKTLVESSFKGVLTKHVCGVDAENGSHFEILIGGAIL